MAKIKTFLSVQQLRAIAALGVLVFHVEVQIERMGYEGYWPNFLSSGVDIFFVISGFIMWVTTYGRDVSPVKFIWNRIERIVPLYWIVTTFAVFVLLIKPEWMQSGALDWAHTLKSYFFIPSVHPVKTGSMEPLIFAGWTLNYEMLFYAIFAVALLLAPAFRLTTVLAVLVGFAATRYVISPEPLSLAWFYTSDIILEFGLGMLIGWWITGGRSLPTSASVALVVLGSLSLALFATRYDLGLSRFVQRGLPAAAIVVGAICCEVNGKVIQSRLLGYLGDTSYSIYLVHGVVLSAIAQVWRRVLPEAMVSNYLLFTVIAVLVSCAASFAVYEIVEKPIAQALKSKGRRRQLAVSRP